MKVENFPDRQIHVKGKDYLYFGGTSYLGMSTNNKFQELVFQGIKKWGASYGSSRNANITLSVYEEAEALFSDWIEAESSVTVSSGALAGKMVIDYLSKNSVTFFHYPKTHPAILAKNSLPLFINGKLHPRLLDDTNEEIVITADIMCSLEVFPTSFEFLNAIPKQKLINLIVDESHSLGIVGSSGKGVFSSIPSNRLKRKIMISSLGKALGLSGGIIASDIEFIESIKSESSFVTSSGCNVAYLDAFINSKSIYDEQRDKLSGNMNYLFSELKTAIKQEHNQDYPVLYFSKKGFYKSLLEKGIVITSFDYPSYNEPMNRVVITANHLEDDLRRLAVSLNNTI